MLEFFRLWFVTWDTGQWFVFQVYVIFVWAAMLPRQLFGAVFHYVHRGAHITRRQTRDPIRVIVMLIELIFACFMIVLVARAFPTVGVTWGVILVMVLVLVLRAVHAHVTRPFSETVARALVWVARQPERLLRIVIARSFYVRHMALLTQVSKKRYAVTAVVTVYREDPDVLKEALERVLASLQRASCDFVFVAAIDGLKQHDRSAEQVIRVASKYCDVVLGTDACNKRWNLRLLVTVAARAFARKYPEAQYPTEDRITVFLDSDTVPIGTDQSMVIERLLVHFNDPVLGGVTTAQEILKPRKNLVRRVNHWLERARLYSSQAMMSLYGQVACLPGRLYAVRTFLIEGELDVLVNDTFSYFGWLRRPCVAGDDRFFTNCVLKARYRTVVEPSARVGTECPDSFMETCRMWARWGRSSQGYTLRSPWLLRYRIAAFIYGADMIVSVSTVYIVAIHWPFMAIFGDSTVPFMQALVFAMLGMMLTMSVRQMSHLIKSPRDILVLPLFVVVVTLGQFVRVYALLTQHKIGAWGTRGGAEAAREPSAWLIFDPQSLTTGSDLPQ